MPSRDIPCGATAYFNVSLCAPYTAWASSRICTPCRCDDMARSQSFAWWHVYSRYHSPCSTSLWHQKNPFNTSSWQHQHQQLRDVSILLHLHLRPEPSGRAALLPEQIQELNMCLRPALLADPDLPMPGPTPEPLSHQQVPAVSTEVRPTHRWKLQQSSRGALVNLVAPFGRRQ